MTLLQDSLIHGMLTRNELANLTTADVCITTFLISIKRIEGNPCYREYEV